MKTLTATLANGTKATRTTTHAYTHVVICTYADGTEGVWKWSSREDLAQKELRRLMGRSLIGYVPFGTTSPIVSFRVGLVDAG